MTDFLRRKGYEINPKRTRRLMEIMGIEAIAPKPKTTVFAKGHKVYPYLLRNMKIEQPDHVWCSDITYIPTKNGYLYLCAVMDWYSRYVLSWRLSNSMDTTIVMDALEEALCRGKPRIFNTDQGAQFTSSEFTNRWGNNLGTHHFIANSFIQATKPPISPKTLCGGKKRRLTSRTFQFFGLA